MSALSPQSGPKRTLKDGCHQSRFYEYTPWSLAHLIADVLMKLRSELTFFLADGGVKLLPCRERQRGGVALRFAPPRPFLFERGFKLLDAGVEASDRAISFGGSSKRLKQPVAVLALPFC